MKYIAIFLLALSLTACFGNDGVNSTHTEKAKYICGDNNFRINSAETLIYRERIDFIMTAYCSDGTKVDISWWVNK